MSFGIDWPLAAKSMQGAVFAEFVLKSRCQLFTSRLAFYSVYISVNGYSGPFQAIKNGEMYEGSCGVAESGSVDGMQKKKDKTRGTSSNLTLTNRRLCLCDNVLGAAMFQTRPTWHLKSILRYAVNVTDVISVLHAYCTQYLFYPPWLGRGNSLPALSPLPSLPYHF